MSRLSRDELVTLVKRIMACEGTDSEQDQWILEFERNVPHPGASDLIFFPKRNMTAEEIVDEALFYKPIQLPG
jgi:hypothetical protein